MVGRDITADGIEGLPVCIRIHDLHLLHHSLVVGNEHSHTAVSCGGTGHDEIPGIESCKGESGLAGTSFDDRKVCSGGCAA